MPAVELHVLAGWLAVSLGVFSGAAMGLLFHDETWAGGYGSFRRRMLRLGHISFFGIGFLNFFFALTLTEFSLPETTIRISSTCFLTALITMPSCCYLTAWKKPFRHIFPIPVLAVLAGVIPILIHWPAS
ncbi:MAG: hypothetical protein OEW73_15480 [Gammaproteobacteria bacterium]|jgi:hypothetical protein|nr:hypothetical protein [Gammaproteobacteria bacterium]MDH5242174.1 hypothetical protein [Gammaproteobacteria bacterium]MDH5584132.1 hypothetical protein [Gammaproteobacteria bacterium]